MSVNLPHLQASQYNRVAKADKKLTLKNPMDKINKASVKHNHQVE